MKNCENVMTVHTTRTLNKDVFNFHAQINSRIKQG